MGADQGFKEVPTRPLSRPQAFVAILEKHFQSGRDDSEILTGLNSGTLPQPQPNQRRHPGAALRQPDGRVSQR